MSAEPFEQWRQRLHEVFRLREPRAKVVRDDARQAQLLKRAAWRRELSRSRDELFGEEMFAEPAFDLLLDLYLAEHGVSVERTTSGASWRYFAALESRGLVERAPDGDDPRRARLRLTVVATEVMERFLEIS